MNSVRYTCKICGQPGTAKYADEFDVKCVSKWVEMLTCDPCYRSRQDEQKARDTIIAATTAGLALGMTTKRRDQVVIGTKLLARVLCSRLRLTTVWQQDFPDMLCDRPDKAWKILLDYEAGLKNLKQQEMHL